MIGEGNTDIAKKLSASYPIHIGVNDRGYIYENGLSSDNEYNKI